MTSTTTVGAAANNISAAQSSLSSNQDTFLKLLTAQLTNQDPLSPVDSTQFTQQLVQMTGVQQQLLTNELLTSLVSSQGGVGGSVGLIGKQVTASTDAGTLKDGAASWSYNLNSSAADVTAQITDASGNIVWSSDEGGLTSGDHTITWDGKGLDGSQLPDGGTYSLSITAKDSSGAAVGASTFQKGVVTGIQTVDGQAVILLNNTQIPLSAVTSVENAS